MPSARSRKKVGGRMDLIDSAQIFYDPHQDRIAREDMFVIVLDQ